jgi:DNA primase
MPTGKPRGMGHGWDAMETPAPGNVLAAVEELGVEVIRVVDEEIVAMCPMHIARTGKQDRHPSWSVNTESGIHNCFSCGYKGPFVKLAEDMLDVTRADAVRWVKARGGIERARKILDRIVEPAPKLDTTKQINEASLALMDSPPIKEIKKRRLTREVVQHHGILWDSQKRCWILPIRDPDTHRLWGWQEKSDKYFRNRPREVKKSKTLFGLDVFRAKIALLVESPLDAARITCVGIPEVGGLGTFGASVSEDQMKLVLNLVDIAIIGMDNPAIDSAGKRSAVSLRDNWARRGLILRFLNYGALGSKDPGDMTDEEIRDAVRTAHSSIRARF